MARGKRLWVRTVTTVSTAPPPGLFTKNARTIARTLASPRVSPKGPTSGLRMLMFFINRAGKGLGPRRRAELLRAKRLMQEMVAKERRFVSPS
jgi:tRNA(adenine34) deaminase